MRIFEAYINGLIESFNIKDRASRSDFWLFLLMNYIVYIALAFVAKELALAYGLIQIPASFTIMVRRLVDIGRSRKLIFIGMIPLVGPFWMLYFMCLRSAPKQETSSEYSFA